LSADASNRSTFRSGETAPIDGDAALRAEKARLSGQLREAEKQIARQSDIALGLADALAESEQRLRMALDAGRMGMWEWTAARNLFDMSPTLEEMHGLAPGEFDGSLDSFLKSIHPDDRTMVAEQIHRTREEKTDHRIEYRVILPDGSVRWIEGRGKMFCEPTGQPQRMIGVCLEITQRKWAEETLQRSKQELEQLVDERTRELQAANQLLQASNRELEDFASVASHDLQEPLRKIQAFGDRLEQTSGHALGEQGRDYLARMLKAAGRMQRLIGDLLQFARVTTKAQPFVPVDLNGVLADVLSDLESRIEQSRGQVEPGPLPLLDADPTQMRQLLQNLVANALKFHKPGVPPRVRVYTETDPREGMCRVCVADNGIGFDEKYLDRIFNVFQRLHGRQEYEGTGIGLAVCRKIAERHGGSITARSRPGEGAVFVVTLPLRHAATEPAGENANAG
jgi:PAS domain S-box-containing protein